MALREEFRAAGDWLFRRRSYLPLVLFALLLWVTIGFRGGSGGRGSGVAWEVVCCLLALAGQAVRVAALGFVPAGTSGGNVSRQRAEALNTTGMYSVVRHPLYLGNFLMWMGVALLARHGWFAVVVALVFWLYYERIMFAEEEFLRERHGEDFLRWAERTPAFLPRLSGWVPPALPFSLRAVLKREYPSFFAIVACFAGIDMVRDSVLSGRAVFDPVWGAVLAAGAVGFLTLRTLKHAGRLDVPGR
jgi:protein-S-isoprenylcysteine O-methyltransferase Ste14